jgi:hypothetical protein
LIEAIDILGKVEGIHFCYFDDGDVVRHHLVQRIIRAYEDYKGRTEQLSLSLELKSSGGTATVRSSDGRVYTTSIEGEAALAEVPSDEAAAPQERISE